MMEMKCRCSGERCEAIGRTVCCFDCEHANWCMTKCDDRLCRIDRVHEALMERLVLMSWVNIGLIGAIEEVHRWSRR